MMMMNIGVVTKKKKKKKHAAKSDAAAHLRRMTLFLRTTPSLQQTKNICRPHPPPRRHPKRRPVIRRKQAVRRNPNMATMIHRNQTTVCRHHNPVGICRNDSIRRRNNVTTIRVTVRQHRVGIHHDEPQHRVVIYRHDQPQHQDNDRRRIIVRHNERQLPDRHTIAPIRPVDDLFDVLVLVLLCAVPRLVDDLFDVLVLALLCAVAVPPATTAATARMVTTAKAITITITAAMTPKTTTLIAISTITIK